MQGRNHHTVQDGPPGRAVRRAIAVSAGRERRNTPRLPESAAGQGRAPAATLSRGEIPADPSGSPIRIVVGPLLRPKSLASPAWDKCTPTPGWSRIADNTAPASALRCRGNSRSADVGGHPARGPLRGGAQSSHFARRRMSGGGRMLEASHYGRAMSAMPTNRVLLPRPAPVPLRDRASAKAAQQRRPRRYWSPWWSGLRPVHHLGGHAQADPREFGGVVDPVLGVDAGHHPGRPQGRQQAGGQIALRARGRGSLAADGDGRILE